MPEMPNAGCHKCEWCRSDVDDKAKCDDPENYTLKMRWWGDEKIYKQSPKKRNKNRDCPGFKKKCEMVTVIGAQIPDYDGAVIVPQYIPDGGSSEG